jgi:hypothetical protein
MNPKQGAPMNLTRIHQLSLFAVAVLLVLPSVAAAQSVNYFAFGSNAEYFPNPLGGDFSGVGTGTHLGQHTFFGNVKTTPTGLFSADWQSTIPQETVD